ncbi:MAG: hypothetical protein J7599_07430 [Niabella sp.]|nr:hypothetical protein [Niabella sp.]
MSNEPEILTQVQPVGFKNGVTFGRIYQAMADGKNLIGPEVDFFIRKEIKHMVEVVCHDFGYKACIDGPYMDGWCRFSARKIDG